MAELDDEGHVGPTSDPRNPVLHRLLGGVVIESEAARRDPPDRFDSRSLDDERARARLRQHPVMGGLCQLFQRPSSAEYWHIGLMTIRLRIVRPPTFIGENRAGSAMRQGLREERDAGGADPVDRRLVRPVKFGTREGTWRKAGRRREIAAILPASVALSQGGRNAARDFTRIVARVQGTSGDAAVRVGPKPVAPARGLFHNSA